MRTQLISHLTSHVNFFLSFHMRFWHEKSGEFSGEISPEKSPEIFQQGDALRCRFFAKCRLKKIPWRIDIVTGIPISHCFH